MTAAAHTHQLPMGGELRCSACGKSAPKDLREVGVLLGGRAASGARRSDGDPFFRDMDRVLQEVLSRFTERPCACGRLVRSSKATPECEPCAARRKGRETTVQAQREFLETVPEKFRTAILGAELAGRVTPPRAIAATQEMCLAEPWIAFVGPAGAGKTSLAVALIRERIRLKGEGWKMFQARQLASARIQHRAGAGEAPIVAEAMGARFALLDDIGYGPRATNDPIADIVFARDAACLPTWITTGLAPVEAGTRYGGGVERRIFEQSKVIALGSRG